MLAGAAGQWRDAGDACVRDVRGRPIVKVKIDVFVVFAVGPHHF